jgi:hypothetical protein
VIFALFFTVPSSNGGYRMEIVSRAALRPHHRGVTLKRARPNRSHLPDSRHHRR